MMYNITCRNIIYRGRCVILLYVSGRYRECTLINCDVIWMECCVHRDGDWSGDKFDGNFMNRSVKVAFLTYDSCHSYSSREITVYLLRKRNKKNYKDFLKYARMFKKIYIIKEYQYFCLSDLSSFAYIIS